MFTLTLDDFREVRARIAPHIKHTPLLTSRQLSELTGFEVRLKAEMFQRVGSYKIRGPLNKFALMPDEQKARGVVCSSAGNHAQGVALAAKIHGIRAVVCMATNATPSKIAATRGYGAEVVLHGNIWDEANEKAKELVRTEGLTYVHPFDDEQLIAGQGTLGLEVVQDWPELDAIVVPIGGGGLMSGVSIAARAIKPDIELIGVEAELYPSMKCAIQNCQMPLGGDTLAEGIAVKHPGELTSRILAELADDVVLVSERDLERAVAMLVGIEKTVVEGAGAAGLAAILSDPPRYQGKKVGTLLCGGNIDTHLLANVLVRDLVRQGRIARLHVAAHDQPGALAAITAKVYEAGVNVIEVNHSRIFTQLPAKDTMIEVECEARDARSIDDVVARLEAAGFRVERASLD